MIIYKRVLGFFISIILTLSLLLTCYFPNRIFIFIFISVFSCLFYFWTIKNRFIPYSLLFKYLLIILFFLSSFWLFFIVVDVLLLKYLLLLFILIYLIIFFNSVFKKIYLNKDIDHPLLIYIDLFCFWFISYFLLYAIIIFRVGYWWTSLGLLASIVFSILIRFYWQQINFKKNFLYLLGSLIILEQVFIIGSFLALNLYSLTFILWIWYYLLTDFFVDKIKEEFIWHKKKKLIFFVLALFIFYLISVR